MIISAAVSSGSPRPTGLNGSCRLSAPARRARRRRAAPCTAVSRTRHRDAAMSRPCRNRLVCGRATTLMPAAATCSATSRWRCSGCMPRLTQWLAVTPWGKPVASTRSARSSRPQHRRVERLVGVQVDAAARPRRRSSAAVVGRVRVGLEVRAAADEVDAHGDRLAQQGALVGAAVADDRPARRSATIWMSTRSRSRSRTSTSASTDVSRLPSVTSTCVRIAVQPLAASSRAARSARSIVSSSVIESRGRVHRQDRAQQVAGRVGDPLGEERLVEVGVRLGERREQTSVAGRCRSSARLKRRSRDDGEMRRRRRTSAVVDCASTSAMAAGEGVVDRSRRGGGRPLRRRGASARSSPRG